MRQSFLALERTQPVPAVGLVDGGGIVHAYIATETPPCLPLDVANGSVLVQCKPRHRHQEFRGSRVTLRATFPNTWMRI
jgi:putative transposase